MNLQRLCKRLVIAATLIATLFTIVDAQTAGTTLITGATLIDGTGSAPRKVAVRIGAGKITAVGALTPRAGETVLDASGLVLAPGFIDIHNHSERGLDEDSKAATQVLQGITTLAAGPDGGSPFPVGDWLAKRAAAPANVNVMSFVGHATVRQRVMGAAYKRHATATEIAAMARLVEQGMREGAVGLSSGLEYDIGNPAATEELITLARVAAKHRGIYMSHIRDEADDMMKALAEAIRIGREAKIPVQISHIKLGTVNVWNKAAAAIALVDKARRAGVDMTADCYPYDAWSSTITVLVPSRRHEDLDAVRRGIADVGGANNILITRCQAHPDYEGQTLGDIARETFIDPAAVYMRIVKDGGAGVVCRSMQEADIEMFYRQPWVMVASDGGIGMRHPRGAGAFPRVLGVYVRERKWITLPQAIHKMTGMPAARLGLRDRGLVRPGMKADLVLFDADRIIDHSTMTSPFLPATGVRHVFVNGAQVVRDGVVTEAKSGQVIRR
ncbi:MAG: N-acyl-D-amino-acid deacylase family protein [Blastocatellia bacterium]